MVFRALKNILISCLGTLCGLWLPLAWSTIFSTDVTLPKGPVTPAVTPAKILLMDTGYIDTPPLNVPGFAGSAFYTNKACPPNFTPYVTIETTKIPNLANTSYLGGFGVCVQSLLFSIPSYQNGTAPIPPPIASIPASYQVYYLSNKQYGQIGATAVNGGSGISSSDIYDATQARGLNWTLYCYPSNVPPPFSSSWTGFADPRGSFYIYIGGNNCTTGSAPF